MLELSHRGWKTGHDRNDGLFPISKSASLVDYLRSSREEKLWVRELQFCSVLSAVHHCRSLGWHGI